MLTLEEQRAHMKEWVETWRQVEELRWQELAALDEQRAFEASDALIELALLHPLPADRLSWSGLVEQQDLFHRRRP